jgi:hypothetical protein
LFDLPLSSSERASDCAIGLADRCEAVGGDFCGSAWGADAYLLKHVIHGGTTIVQLRS